MSPSLYSPVFNKRVLLGHPFHSHTGSHPPQLLWLDKENGTAAPPPRNGIDHEHETHLGSTEQQEGFLGISGSGWCSMLVQSFQISVYRPGWSRTHSNPPASASWALGLQVWTTTRGCDSLLSDGSRELASHQGVSGQSSLVAGLWLLPVVWSPFPGAPEVKRDGGSDADSEGFQYRSSLLQEGQGVLWSQGN